MNAYRSASSFSEPVRPFYASAKSGQTGMGKKQKSSSDKSEELLNIFSYEFRSYYLTYLSPMLPSVLELAPFPDYSD